MAGIVAFCMNNLPMDFLDYKSCSGFYGFPAPMGLPGFLGFSDSDGVAGFAEAKLQRTIHRIRSATWK